MFFLISDWNQFPTKKFFQFFIHPSPRPNGDRDRYTTVSKQRYIPQLYHCTTQWSEITNASSHRLGSNRFTSTSAWDGRLTMPEAPPRSTQLQQRWVFNNTMLPLLMHLNNYFLQFTSIRGKDPTWHASPPSTKQRGYPVSPDEVPIGSPRDIIIISFRYFAPYWRNRSSIFFHFVRSLAVLNHVLSWHLSSSCHRNLGLPRGRV